MGWGLSERAPLTENVSGIKGKGLKPLFHECSVNESRLIKKIDKDCIGLTLCDSKAMVA